VDADGRQLTFEPSPFFVGLRESTAGGVNCLCFADLDQRSVVGEFRREGDGRRSSRRFEHLYSAYPREVDERRTAQFIDPVVEDAGEYVCIHLRTHRVEEPSQPLCGLQDTELVY